MSWASFHIYLFILLETVQTEYCCLEKNGTSGSYFLCSCFLYYIGLTIASKTWNSLTVHELRYCFLVFIEQEHMTLWSAICIWDW